MSVAFGSKPECRSGRWPDRPASGPASCRRSRTGRCPRPSARWRRSRPRSGSTLGDFFAAATGGEGGLIVRVADRQALSSGWSAAEIEALSVPGPRARLEALLITLRPGGRSGKHPYTHEREEFAFVTRGEVMLTLGPEEHRLRRGDAATIRPGELRLWRNAAKAPVQILIIASSAGAAAPPHGHAARALRLKEARRRRPPAGPEGAGPADSRPQQGRGIPGSLALGLRAQSPGGRTRPGSGRVASLGDTSVEER